MNAIGQVAKFVVSLPSLQFYCDIFLQQLLNFDICTIAEFSVSISAPFSLLH